jgi:hypothetical protein
LSAAQRRGAGEPEEYAPEATRASMENVSLNCKRYICTVLYGVMMSWTRELFMRKTYQHLQKIIIFFYRLGVKKKDQKDNFIFCLKYLNFKCVYLIFSFYFFKL